MSAPPLQVDPDTERLLEAYGFDATTFEVLRARLVEGRATAAANRLRAPVEPPGVTDVVPLPALGTPERARLAAVGAAALARGEVGAVVLAGGMATRFGGAVKAAVEALDGRSFLDLKLADIRRTAERAARPVPVYLMTSFATHAQVSALGARASSPLAPVAAFAQFISVRLCPDGTIFRDDAGRPSLYAPGHGDLTFALRRSGLLDRFRAGGGRVLFMSNVDNLTATLDPAVLGAHLESQQAITVEVAPKDPGDAGGAPARVDGRMQIVETFRFPETFDQARIPVFNTNTLLFDAAAIDRDFDLTWFLVKKKVDGRDAIQFERLVGELTAFLPSRFLQVARTGADARFQPVKDPPELAQRRPEIRAVLEARGVL